MRTEARETQSDERPLLAESCRSKRGFGWREELRLLQSRERQKAPGIGIGRMTALADRSYSMRDQQGHLGSSA